MEAHDSSPSRKEHLEISCEICYACSQLPGKGPTDVDDDDDDDDDDELYIICDCSIPGHNYLSFALYFIFQ